MAEERLMDDDKDKKYRIRVNEDGEEELYLSEEAEEEGEYKEFEVPEFAYDDEEAVAMTPEQLFAAMEQKRVEEEKRAAKLVELKATIEEAMQQGDLARAEAAADEGIITDETCGLFYCVKLRALTDDFNDNSLLEQCVDMAEGVKNYATDEQKQELYNLSLGKLTKDLDEKRALVDDLNAQNEEKKQQRRNKFVPAKKRAQIWFVATGVPFVIFAILTAIFGSLMFSRQDGLFMILAIIFAGVTLMFGAVTVFTARNFVSASRNVRANEKDSSTKLGRNLLKERTALEQLERIYASIIPNN